MPKTNPIEYARLDAREYRTLTLRAATLAAQNRLAIDKRKLTSELGVKLRKIADFLERSFVTQKDSGQLELFYFDEEVSPDLRNLLNLP